MKNTRKEESKSPNMYNNQETDSLGNESKESKESLKEILENIDLLSYENLNGFEEYLEIKDDLPEEFWNKIESSKKEEENLMMVLLRIRESLFDLYGEERNNADSFSDSRFTSINEMIDRKLVSCGSFVKIFGTALRKLEIPVKFIHGIFEEQKNLPKEIENRHSWLEIHNPQNQEWVPIDFTEGSLELSSTAQKIKEYFNWDELKKDYDEGNF